MDLLGPTGNPLAPDPAGNSGFNFSVIIPEPFKLSNHSDDAKNKIRDEIMDKAKSWEKKMSKFFDEYNITCDSWRMRPKSPGSKKPTGLFNSRSGETHRAAETIATIWTRMLTAADPYFEAVSEGLDDFGQEMTREQLYGVERVIVKQLRYSRYKEKCLRTMRSLALMGTAIVERPFVSLPYGDGQKSIEYTDIVFRSLLKTGFDPTVFDINMSDYLFTIDFHTKYRLRNMATAGSEYWDRDALEEYLTEFDGLKKNSAKNSTDAWNRLTESRRRAGYTDIDNELFEFIDYHGKIETDNEIVAALWESQGRQDDPKFIDFTCGLINGSDMIKFHETQYGTWRSRFGVTHFKTFEDEPLGYGIGKIGRRNQREQDITQSRANDILMFALYNMWKVGRFAGLKADQLNIKPWNLVQLDDINQLEPIQPNIAALQQAIEMMAIGKEDFRNTVGAQTNLQAQITKASATEASLAQTEAIRGASVHAEIIAETFLREHIETMHLNNLNYLDAPIWIAATGSQKPMSMNKDTMPRNIGFEIKTVTDKDFRPERGRLLLEGINLVSSVRNIFPPVVALNFLKSNIVEWVKTMGMNPADLERPIPVAEQLAYAMQKAQQQGGGGAASNEVAGEKAGEQSGATNTQQTPVGPVATSPLGSQGLVQGL